jgi:hypothetical protein
MIYPSSGCGSGEIASSSGPSVITAYIDLKEL